MDCLNCEAKQLLNSKFVIIRVHNYLYIETSVRTGVRCVRTWHGTNDPSLFDFHTTLHSVCLYAHVEKYLTVTRGLHVTYLGVVHPSRTRHVGVCATTRVQRLRNAYVTPVCPLKVNGIYTRTLDV